MKKLLVSKTKYYSYVIGNLPKGCRLCVKGSKTVLFITGICNVHCFYCPISEQKHDKDVLYVNEWQIHFNKDLTNKELKNIKKEIELCDSQGIGITGGDPLIKTERTVKIIKFLKKQFGKKFHMHLYTPLKNINNKKLNKIYKAGLDEIRFHPVIWDDKDWNKINFGLKYNWDIGVEIPIIPGYEKQTKKLIDFLNGKIKFFNLNELEISDTNAQELVDKNYIPKDRISYGVLGSEQLAIKLMNYIIKKKYNFNVHYCTTTLKDKVQLAKRIKRRVKNIALKTDIITKDGMLKRGVIYLPELKPSFSYHNKINSIKKIQKNKIINQLKKSKFLLLKKLKIKNNELSIDEQKIRILTSQKIIKKYQKKIKKINLIPALIEEYPTHDGMEIEVKIF